MDIPVVERRVEVGRFMPDLKPGYNPIRMHGLMGGMRMAMFERDSNDV